MKTKLKALVVALVMMATPVTISLVTAESAAAASCQNRTYFNYYVWITGAFRPTYYSVYLDALRRGVPAYKTSYTVCI